MLFDPFTVIVQIINFAILLVALKVVLFDRIVRHMDERQTRITERRKEADERLAEAEEKGRQLDRRLSEIEREREERLAEARETATQRRQELIEEARREVEEQRDRWWEALGDEQDRLMGRLRMRVGEEVTKLTRRALVDLADAELQARLVGAFERRIESLEADERHQLKRWVVDDGHPTMVSATELDDEQREQLVRLVRGLAEEDVEVDFQQDAGLVAGLEIQVGGRAFGWSVDGYLEQMDESLREIMRRDGATREDAGASAG